ncbi:hypothetical protein C8F01DRAFT_1367511 [Mycena amicta]|nr:hypothetical protein C8F01DRAFT_1367511 [Mycena amicta]
MHTRNLPVYFPDEIWHEILQYAPKDLSGVSLASDRLRRISLPFLFSDFAFYPFYVTTSKYSGQIGLRDKIVVADVDKALDRLEFWSSSRIAPLVRTCTISEGKSGPNTSTKSPNRFNDSERHDADLLQAAFFEKLVRFTRLKSLSASSSIYLGGRDIYSLTLIHELESLSTSCSVPGAEQVGGPTRKVKVRSFSFILDKNYWSEGGDLLSWLSHLDPGSLCHVELPVELVNFPVSTKLDRFPHVKSLRAAWWVGERNMARNEALLSLFPNVEKLELCLGEDQYYPNSSRPEGRNFFQRRPFPALKNLQIPDVLVSTFIPLAFESLTHLSVDSFTCAQLKDALKNQLSLHGTCTLTSLVLNTAYHNVLEFCEIVIELSSLATLKFLTKEWAQWYLDPHKLRSTVLKRLILPTNRLPTSLVAFAFIQCLDRDELDTALAPMAIRSSFQARCPNLSLLWLEGTDFVVRSRRNSASAGVEFRDEIFSRAQYTYGRSVTVSATDDDGDETDEEEEEDSDEEMNLDETGSVECSERELNEIREQFNGWWET